MMMVVGETVFNVKGIKELAKAIVDIDLSTTVKDKTEAIVTMSMLFNNCSESEAANLAHTALKHTFVTIAFVCPQRVMGEFLTAVGGVFTITDTSDDAFRLIFVTKSIHDWLETLSRESNEYQVKDVLVILNELYKQFENTGYRRFLLDYTKERAKWPNTFYLREKD